MQIIHHHNLKENNGIDNKFSKNQLKEDILKKDYDEITAVQSILAHCISFAIN